MEKLVEEWRWRQPHPHASVHRPVGIEQQLLEHLHSLLPRYPQVASRQEARNGVTGQVMNPSLLAQLRHYRVDPRKARLTLPEIYENYKNDADYRIRDSLENVGRNPAATDLNMWK